MAYDPLPSLSAAQLPCSIGVACCAAEISLSETGEGRPGRVVRLAFRKSTLFGATALTLAHSLQRKPVFRENSVDSEFYVALRYGFESACASSGRPDDLQAQARSSGSNKVESGSASVV